MRETQKPDGISFYRFSIKIKIDRFPSLDGFFFLSPLISYNFLFFFLFSFYFFILVSTVLNYRALTNFFEKFCHFEIVLRKKASFSVKETREEIYLYIICYQIKSWNKQGKREILSGSK